MDTAASAAIERLGQTLSTLDDRLDRFHDDLGEFVCDVRLQVEEILADLEAIND